jgi:hypothetical protein
MTRLNAFLGGSCAIVARSALNLSKIRAQGQRWAIQPIDKIKRRVRLRLGLSGRRWAQNRPEIIGNPGRTRAGEGRRPQNCPPNCPRCSRHRCAELPRRIHCGAGSAAMGRRPARSRPFPAVCGVGLGVKRRPAPLKRARIDRRGRPRSEAVAHQEMRRQDHPVG